MYTPEYLTGLSIELMLIALFGVIAVILACAAFVSITTAGKGCKNSAIAKWFIIGIFAFVIFTMISNAF